jgi:hypothetical protein
MVTGTQNPAGAQTKAAGRGQIARLRRDRAGLVYLEMLEREG